MGVTKAKVLAIFVLVLAVAFVATTGCTTAAAQEGSPGKPNIVLILADDMRYDDLRHMPKVNNLLVQQGMSFSETYAPLGVCCPSRASTLTGKYAHNHETWDNSAPDGGWPRFRDAGNEVSTVAVWLKAQGYNTALMGKYLNDYSDANHVPQGWDRWFAKLDPGVQKYYDYDVSNNGTLRHYGTDPADYHTDVLDGKVQEHLSNRAGSTNPFFMYISPIAPHENENKPPPPAPRHKNLFSDLQLPIYPNYDEDTSDKNSITRNLRALTATDKQKMTVSHRQRIRSLQAVDDLVGNVVSKLQALGKLDNTHIVFTSDNGFHHGEHRYIMTKRTPYDESLRLPLVVRGPGIAPNTTTDKIALVNDFAPTFAEWGGAAVPADVDGRSLDPVLKGTATTWRDAFLVESKRGTPTNDSNWYGIRKTGDRKYMEFGSSFKELYDLTADPYELENSYDPANPPTDLKARLEALKTCAGESCRVAEDGP